MSNQELPGRILIIDDNVEAAEMLQMLLNLEGYETLIMANGADGIAAVGIFNPHVVCSDLNMPGMSGFEFAQRFRAMTNTKNILLVAITGRAEADTVSELTSAGFDTYFFKPLQFERLSQALRTFFRFHPVAG